MKATWIGFFLLAFVLSVSCSTIKISKELAATNPGVGTPSVVSATHTASNDKTATETLPMGLGTLQAFRTGYAETRTRAPTLANTPTSSPSPTCRPLPESLTPGATFLMRRGDTVTDTLAALMLQAFGLNSKPGYPLPAFTVIDNLFGIEIVDGSIDPSWTVTEVVPNTDYTRGVFFSYDPEPSPEDQSARLIWFETARKMWIKDFETDKVYRVKWDDGLPYRPIDIEGWPTKDIFVFSQYANPWHGFLYAIDARQKKVLLTLQLEDWC